MLDRTLLKAGLSKPWRETLMEAIGTDELDPSAVLDYFQPLSDYLDEQLGDEPIGWDSHYSDFYRSTSRNEDPAKFLEDLDPIYLREANTQMKARWQYITDITDSHSEAQVVKDRFSFNKYLSCDQIARKVEDIFLQPTETI